MVTWAEVTAPPSEAKLRQFAGLCLLAGVALPVWQATHGGAGRAVLAGGALAAIAGIIGLVRPSVLRPVFVAWVVAAFPLGWAISRLVLAGLFYGVFTPLAAIFRITGRDALRLRRGEERSYWSPKASPLDVSDYFRQS